MDPYSLSKPYFYVLTGETSTVDQLVAKLRYETASKIAVRMFRGKNMESTNGFYDELAAALQFPLYFGRNWDALDECLADLEWLPSDAYLLVFADAPHVLKSAGGEEADVFLKILARICDEWTSRSSLGGGLQRKPRPFHVVLHAEAAEADQFAHRVEVAVNGPVSKLMAS